MTTYNIIDASYRETDIVPHGPDGFNLELGQNDLAAIERTSQTYQQYGYLRILVDGRDVGTAFNFQSSTMTIVVSPVIDQTRKDIPGQFVMSKSLFKKLKKVYDNTRWNKDKGRTLKYTKF